jgi:hypothetical protein
MKSFLVAVVCLLFLGEGVWASSPDDILARAKGWQIDRRELDFRFKRLETELFATGRILGEDERVEAKGRLLERLIFSRLCMEVSTEADRANGVREAQGFLDDIKQAYGEDGYRRMLTRLGYTEPDFVEEKKLEAMVTLTVNRAIRAEVRIPESDIRRFYEENPKRFEEPGYAEANILFISTVDPATGLPLAGDALQSKERLVRRIQDRVKSGDDFEALVRRYTDAEPTREKGGRIRFMKGELPPALEGATFSMSVGQVSDVVRTELGLHLIRLLEKVPPRKVPLEQVENDIREVLIRREVETRIPEFAQRLRREQAVEVTEAGKNLR